MTTHDKIVFIIGSISLIVSAVCGIYAAFMVNPIFGTAIAGIMTFFGTAIYSSVSKELWRW